jgi:hypothetical protein
MNLQCGDLVDLIVNKIMPYACWGTADGKTGFAHCVDWSIEKPVPANLVPVVGQTIKVRVFYLSSLPISEQPADVSCNGTIKVDFACPRALVDDSHWKDFLEKQSNN